MKRRPNKLKSQENGTAAIGVGPVVVVADAISRTFPGPPGAQTPLRVALDSQASDDISAHTRESPNAEVCGVLVGNFCQDAEGIFTHITHAIRGAGATEGSTHVTFTQATWTAIHATMDREHQGRHIVGWYHSHPGFGVEFSDMDAFIQRNFFSGAAQVALVTDPADGTVALAMNGPEGIRYLDRYWVDARERVALLPASLSSSKQTRTGTDTSSNAVMADRVAQLTQAIDDLRAWMHGFLLVTGLVICAGFIVLIYSIIREQFRTRIEPPEVQSFIPVPINVGGKTIMIGVGVVNWEIPPELNSLVQEVAKEQVAASREVKHAKAETPVPDMVPEVAPPPAPPLNLSPPPSATPKNPLPSPDPAPPASALKPQ